MGHGLGREWGNGPNEIRSQRMVRADALQDPFICVLASLGFWRIEMMPHFAVARPEQLVACSKEGLQTGPDKGFRATGR